MPAYKVVKMDTLTQEKKQHIEIYSAMRPI